MGRVIKMMFIHMRKSIGKNFGDLDLPSVVFQVAFCGYFAC